MGRDREYQREDKSQRDPMGRDREGQGDLHQKPENQQFKLKIDVPEWTLKNRSGSDKNKLDIPPH